MKKTIVCGLLFLLLLVPQAFAQQADDFEWEVNDRQNAAITGYTGDDRAVVIPNELGGFPVTTVNGSAFANKELICVIIPDSVTSIARRAFANNKLTSVDLPDGLSLIGDGAFANNRLAGISIPTGVTGFGYGAFAHNRLTSINLPDSVRYIDPATFANNRLTGIVIPSGVEEIGAGAFACNPLTSITIGSDVKLRWEVLWGSDSFDRAYMDGGKLAGTYTRANAESTEWVRDE